MIEFDILEKAGQAVRENRMGSPLKTALQPVIDWLEENAEKPDEIRASRLSDALTLRNGNEQQLIEHATNLLDAMKNLFQVRTVSRRDYENVARPIRRWYDLRNAELRV